jgi:hypothetical protein
MCTATQNSSRLNDIPICSGLPVHAARSINGAWRSINAQTDAQRQSAVPDTNSRRQSRGPKNSVSWRSSSWYRLWSHRSDNFLEQEVITMTGCKVFHPLQDRGGEEAVRSAPCARCAGSRIKAIEPSPRMVAPDITDTSRYRLPSDLMTV